MDVFRKFDADGSGTIEKGEFRNAIAKMGFDAPDDCIDELFDEVDDDGSGTVDFKELNSILRVGSLKKPPSPKPPSPLDSSGSHSSPSGVRASAGQVTLARASEIARSQAQ